MPAMSRLLRVLTTLTLALPATAAMPAGGRAAGPDAPAVARGSDSLDLSLLRAVLRPGAYVERLRARAVGAPQSAPVARHLVGDLWVVCVAALPHSTRLLVAADLARLDLSADAAIALGERNLAAALRPMRAAMHPILGESLGSIEGGYYESGRFLLHERWAALARQFGGRLAAAIPGSTLILYGDAGDPAALAALRSLARETFAKQEIGISPNLFRWTETGWVPLAP